MRAPGRASRAWLILLAGLALVLLAPVQSGAQQTVACPKGLQLRLSSPNPTQGSLVLLEVESTQALAALDAAAADQSLRFWRAGNPALSYRALLGVDLEQPAGTLPLTMNAELETGERVACSVLAKVREGEFITERLRVPRRFVELSEENLRRARRESRRLGEIFAAVSPEPLWQGAFQAPLPGVDGSGNFGRRRILNDQPRSPHSGEDYPADAGTPVRAPARGRVALADDFFFSGNTVVLDHGLGLYSFYGHLESIAVDEGEVVEAGALLGQVGATGRVTGAHLHWAVRLNQARINPRELLAIFPGGDE